MKTQSFDIECFDGEGVKWSSLEIGLFYVHGWKGPKWFDDPDEAARYLKDSMEKHVKDLKSKKKSK